MAEKISVAIGLEGGEEVQRQLEGIGKTGQQAFSNIQSAAEQMDFSAIADGFQTIGDTGVQAFDKVKTAAQNAAVFEQIIQAVRKVEGAFESLGNAAVKVGARMTKSLGAFGVLARALGPLGIAAGVAGGAMIKFGDDTADALNNIAAASAKLDLTAQQFSKLQNALTQTGVSQDSILPGLQKLKDELGKDFFPQDVITGFQNFIAQLERMPDGAERTNLAMQKLEDALGAQVIAGLQTGAISSQNFAAALGLATAATQEQIVAAARYQQTLNQLSAAWQEFKAALAVPTTPILQFLVNEIKSLTAGVQGVISAYQTFKAMLSQDFDIPWLLKIVNFDPNLLLSKWLPVLQLIQNALGQGTWPALDALVQKAQAAAQTLAQTGQAGAQAGQQAAQGLELISNPLTGMPELAAKGSQATAQIGIAGQQAGQQAAQGFQVWNEELGKAVPLIQQLKPPDASSWTSWASTVVSAIESAISKLLEWIGLKDKAGSSGGGGGGGTGAPGKARGGLIGGRGTGTSDSNLAWLSRGEFVIRAAAVRHFGTAFFAALNAGRIPGFAAGGLAGIIPGYARGGPAGTTADAIQQWRDDIQAANNATVHALDAAVLELSRVAESITAIKFALSDKLFVVLDDMTRTLNILRGATPAQDSVAAARGGIIGGRGSGTSDSNLAWLSRGEFVIRAAAVRHFGAGFFAALNAGMLPGFALGGLVPRAIPAFAGGGSMSNVTIAFPGLPPVGGLRASSAVVEELQRSAALAQVRSGGRKPSRYS